jgi:hypothetical protein
MICWSWAKLTRKTGQSPPTNLGGLTIQTIANNVVLEPQETVIAFLQRMQRDQILQSRYAAAPICAIMEALGPEDGRMVPWTTNTVLFNWLGGELSGPKRAGVDVVEVTVGRDVFGFFVTAGLAQGKMWIKLRGASLGLQELDEIGIDLKGLVQWTVEKPNAIKPITEFRKYQKRKL